MDFSQALTYQFKDPRWARKFLLVALLSLIPIAGQIITLGWSLGITRRVIEAGAETLPEVDISNDLIRGLKAWGIRLIALLPALLLLAPMGLGFGISLAADDGRATSFWLLTGLCFMGGLIVYALAFTFLLPALDGNYLANGENFQAGLNLKEAFRLVSRNPSAYFLVMIGGILCVMITLLGLAGCIIGVIATGLYAQTIMAHLYGQAYRLSKA